MSGGEVRKVSRQDIQLVQNLIERCLQLYMNQKEVVDTLSFQAKIEPSFTELVHQSACYLSEHASTSARSDGMLCNGVSSSGIINGLPSGQQFVLAGKDVPSLAGSFDPSASMLSTQNSSIGRFNEVNGTAIKTESSYSSNSDFPFCTDNTFLEARPSIGDASAGSFSSSELTGQPLNDPLLDIDTSSFGFLSQIPRNFSFSDLTEDFTQSAENYGRSPFLHPEGNNFLDSPEEECKEEENRRLGTISEGVSYEDFTSD
ncbi:uncharacterized protein [Typha latifolia]|uniref:uncharacterized protein isoform X4 n=1 Tax=Typha latifolia TaxID=4733 RepID=UPI003C2BEB53